jgi:hypothetical protein
LIEHGTKQYYGLLKSTFTLKSVPPGPGTLALTSDDLTTWPFTPTYIAVTLLSLSRTHSHIHTQGHIHTKERSSGPGLGRSSMLWWSSERGPGPEPGKQRARTHQDDALAPIFVPWRGSHYAASLGHLSHSMAGCPRLCR